jgi:antitoxin ParD1/3/4
MASAELAPPMHGTFGQEAGAMGLAQQSLTIFANPHYPRAESPKAPMTLNINLTPHLEKLVRQKVDSGRYNSASEVVREALRLMEKHNELHALQLERLRSDIRQGLDSGPVHPWSPAEMKRQGRKRLAARKAAAG